MRMLAVLLGLMPLILVESGLRLMDNPVATAVDHDPWVNLEQLQPLFVLDRSSGQWSIPESRMNFFRPASFAAVKPAQTRRIFVLGGSTVQGRPYSTETAFSTWLQLRLRAANPELSFEVVNCGGVSYASYRVSKILDELLQHQPDAIVLYTGHNEFLEDRTYAEVRSMGAVNRRISQLAGKLETVRWLRERFAASPIEATELASEVNARLDHSGGLASYVRDPVWRVDVERHFADTFRRMVVTAGHANVPLLVCLPAGDLVNTPPIKTTDRPGLDPSQSSRFRAQWARATDTAIDRDARLNASLACLEIDPEHAGAHFVTGRLRLDRGELDLAIRHLVAARDHDVCPLRATSAITQAIIEITRQQDVPMIDTPRLLDQRDRTGAKRPDGVVDPEVFVDHVHPTIVGHQQLAAEITAELRTAGLFNLSDSNEVEQEYERLAAEHLRLLGEEYYARGQQRLAGLRLWISGRAGQVGIEP
jgi:hypothetical protein